MKDKYCLVEYEMCANSVEHGASAEFVKDNVQTVFTFSLTIIIVCITVRNLQNLLGRGKSKVAF